MPLAAPETAAIVSQPRIFTDPATGAFNGLQNAPDAAAAPVGHRRTRPTPNTNTCHDITAYPEIGLAAGACQGNGILLDISDPANPVRLDAVADPNFSYWHSATFNNDGTKVIFTDEWGGGTAARCRVTDQPRVGRERAVRHRRRQAASSRATTSCRPCRRRRRTAWRTTARSCRFRVATSWCRPGTRAGLSIIDFTDTANPTEIAYLDRGPINTPNPTGLNLGGYWSTYWYNGNVLGSEIARGFDSLALTASDQMSENEIAAAGEIQLDEFNAQLQTKLVHAPSFAVARSYVDQAERAGTLSGQALSEVRKYIDQAEKLTAGP